MRSTRRSREHECRPWLADGDRRFGRRCEVVLDEAGAEIRKLQRGLTKICAWTKRIEVDGRWISVDDFLREYLGLHLTHGISIEGARLFKEE